LPSRNASSSRLSRSRTPSGTRLLDSVTLSGGSSGSALALASSADGVRACRRAQPAPLQSPRLCRCRRLRAAGWRPEHAPNCSSANSPKGAKRCPRQPAIGLFTTTGGKAMASTPRGSVMGLIANDRQRRLGVAPTAGSLRITTYNSDWQISGKWRFEGLRAGKRPGTRPGLACWFGVEPPAGIEPATPSLPSMRGRFTTPCSTSRPHTSAQVERRFPRVGTWGSVRM
jgi:hypothetical protein